MTIYFKKETTELIIGKFQKGTKTNLAWGYKWRLTIKKGHILFKTKKEFQKQYEKILITKIPRKLIVTFKTFENDK